MKKENKVGFFTVVQKGDKMSFEFIFHESIMRRHDEKYGALCVKADFIFNLKRSTLLLVLYYCYLYSNQYKKRI